MAKSSQGVQILAHNFKCRTTLEDNLQVGIVAAMKTLTVCIADNLERNELYPIAEHESIMIENTLNKIQRI